MLDQVETTVQKIIFTVTIYNAEDNGHNFGILNGAKIRVVNFHNNQELLNYNMSEEFDLETAMIFGELYRYKNDWKFRAVGQGFEGGLSTMAEIFGVTVA